MNQFLIKSIIFCVLVAGGQILLAQPLEIPSQVEFLDMLLDLRADIVYLGDSSVSRIAPTDKTRLTTSGILERLARPYGVVDVNGAHYQPGLYQSYCRYLIRQENKPQFVIIPINLRVFCAEWSMNPVYRYEEIKMILAINDTFWEKFHRPLFVFKAAKQKASAIDYDRAKFFRGIEYAGRLRDLEYPPRGETPSVEAFRQMLTMRYLSALSSRHPWLKSLQKSADMLIEAGITPIFYISPVDVQTGEEHFGQEFSAGIARNVSVLRTSLKKEGAYFLDLSRTLRTRDFSWTEDGSSYMNGHLKFEGRMFVAQSIAGAVKSNKK